jgi:hypothetical protein
MADPRFIGTLSLKLADSDPKMMQLKHDFSFIDSGGVIWTAKKGDMVGGTHIPKFLKIIIGYSYQQPYLPAAVLHDVYCNNKSRPWRQTDLMFYQAMLTNGMGQIKALTFYVAVFSYHLFGHGW